jgi:hypothetical protein
MRAKGRLCFLPLTTVRLAPPAVKANKNSALYAGRTDNERRKP